MQRHFHRLTYLKICFTLNFGPHRWPRPIPTIIITAAGLMIGRKDLVSRENRSTILDIEITSCKARAYGIFTRVGEVSEIERVSAANE